MKKSIVKKIDRDHSIDLLKIIAIYFVILIHNFYVSNNFIVNNTFESYTAFIIRLLIEGVLIFIFVNGYLLIDKELDLKKHLKKILRIFILIIIWAVIYSIILPIVFNDNVSIKSIITSVLETKIGHRYNGILWFLQNLIMLYLIFPLIKLVHDKDKKIYNYFFILVAFFTVGINLIMLVSQYVFNILKMYNITNMLIDFISRYNPISNGYFILYFMLGGYVKEYKDKLLNNKNKIYILSIISIIIVSLYGIFYSKRLGYLYSSNFNYNTIFMVFIVIGLYVLFNQINFNKLPKWLINLITFLGNNTMGIYLLHYICSKVFIKFFEINTLIETLGFSLLILVISSILTYIFSKIPYINKIIKL